MRELEDEVVIWYRPRVRVWSDKHGELHVGGEPDGLTKLLDGLRLVARGIEETVSIDLRTDPIEKGRNPVSGRGVKQMFEKVVLKSERAAQPIRAVVKGAAITLHFCEQSQPVLGFAIVEAIDGEGDISIPISMNGATSRMWFWGYSNPHGVNSF
jgi:hypothetical protein